MIEAEVIVALCTIITVCGAIFKYAVLRPLETSIGNLNAAVDRLRGSFRLYEDRLRLCEVQIAELNQRVRSNQHRIDSVEHRLDALELIAHEKTH